MILRDDIRIKSLDLALDYPNFVIILDLLLVSNIVGFSVFRHPHFIFLWHLVAVEFTLLEFI